MKHLCKYVFDRYDGDFTLSHIDVINKPNIVKFVSKICIYFGLLL